ncbi:hypothetical protein [Patiriisocius marinistellae]|nr:hypothetical protein [Patiriisocius marinistellae]
MEVDKVVEQVKDKFVWKKKFTLVLVLNAAYIILFYLLMKHYA